jgi:hypothetical protein
MVAKSTKTALPLPRSGIKLSSRMSWRRQFLLCFARLWWGDQNGTNLLDRALLMG